jgi:hypothetical protein
VPLIAVQPADVVSRQDPLGRQHAPVTEAVVKPLPPSVMLYAPLANALPCQPVTAPAAPGPSGARSTLNGVLFQMRAPLLCGSRLYAEIASTYCPGGSDAVNTEESLDWRTPVSGSSSLWEIPNPPALKRKSCVSIVAPPTVVAENVVGLVISNTYMSASSVPIVPLMVVSVPLPTTYCAVAISSPASPTSFQTWAPATPANADSAAAPRAPAVPSFMSCLRLQNRGAAAQRDPAANNAAAPTAEPSPPPA